MRQILKFRFTCDGYKPNGQPCPCDEVLEAETAAEARDAARGYGWYQDYRGWLCNAGGGHRDDRKEKP